MEDKVNHLIEGCEVSQSVKGSTATVGEKLAKFK